MRLFKRGKIWYGWFYSPSGKQVKVSLKTSDKTIAEKRLKEAERASNDPDRASAAVTLRQALEDAIEAPGYRPRRDATVDFYVKKAGHLVRLLPEWLNDLSALDVQRYIKTRRAEGASDHTIAKELGTLRMGLRNANWVGTFTRPVSSVIPKFGSGYKPVTRHHTTAQALALISAVNENRRAHVAYLYATGARWSESLAAEEGDFLDGGLVRIHGTKTDASDRIVPVAHPWILAGKPPYSGWSNVRRDLAAACESAGVPMVSPNDIRRSCAVWLRQEGVPPNLIGLVLGHVDSRMVERVYGRVQGHGLGAALTQYRKGGINVG